MTAVALIQVPYHAGDDRHPASRGPGAVLDAGVVDVLERQGHSVAVEIADRGAPFRDTASSSAAVNKAVAAKVGAAIDSGRLPIVIAGSCATCQGVLAGFEHAGCGAVWIDAHADFNTPETSASGFFPGMSAAVVAGQCYGDYWRQMGDNTPLREENIVMFGIRDLSPESERERLTASEIAVVGWHEGKPVGDVIAPLDELARRVDDVYLHIDLDGFAPDVAPGTADEPVPGGLSGEDAETIVRACGERFRIRAATLATYAPERDQSDTTLRLMLRLIESIAEHATRASRR